jgi:hypothetical protein
VNQVRTANHWIGIKTVGTKSNRDGIGARVTVKAGERLMLNEVRSGGSYISNSDMRVHFGLGTVHAVNYVEIRWPSGLVERFANPAVDKISTLQEGAGAKVESGPKQK